MSGVLETTAAEPGIDNEIPQSPLERQQPALTSSSNNYCVRFSLNNNSKESNLSRNRVATALHDSNNMRDPITTDHLVRGDILSDVPIKNGLLAEQTHKAGKFDRHAFELRSGKLSPSKELQLLQNNFDRDEGVIEDDDEDHSHNNMLYGSRPAKGLLDDDSSDDMLEGSISSLSPPTRVFTRESDGFSSSQSLDFAAEIQTSKGDGGHMTRSLCDSQLVRIGDMNEEPNFIRGYVSTQSVDFSPEIYLSGSDSQLLVRAQEDATEEPDFLRGSTIASFQSHLPFRRGRITEGSLCPNTLTNLNEFTKWQTIKDWMSTFRRADPRWRILKFFHDVAQEGADKIEQAGIHPELISPLLRGFRMASVFTIWRPTSNDAIGKMMLREGVGKGLDIKGKSAKKGKLSGFVPFLQISDEEHKDMIRVLPKKARVRIFYSTSRARDEARKTLQDLAEEMVGTVQDSKRSLDVHQQEDDDNDHEGDLHRQASFRVIMSWEMANPEVAVIDDYAPQCYGIEVAERLFWEGYVMRQDIARDAKSEYNTGRPSEPSFQEMNFAALRNPKEGEPRPVVYQYADPDKPMCPLNLLMAYEEYGRVMPVVSDFDCFLVGTRGVGYGSPLPPEQIELVKWCVCQIEKIMDSPATETWSSRWLDVLKHHAINGFHPEIPQFGFGDPKSYAIMEHAIDRLKDDGAVRHGAECFNFYFPQELDDQFLVVSDTLPGQVPWKYMDVNELKDFLCDKIEEGFTFPLNPKWILCDGWKHVYDKLMASQRSNVQDSLEAWLPRESGIRERIEAIYERHPNGFERKQETGREAPIRRQKSLLDVLTPDEDEGTAAMDLAELELKYYMTFQRAKWKLRAALIISKLNRSHSCTSEGLGAANAGSKLRAVVDLAQHSQRRLFASDEPEHSQDEPAEHTNGHRLPEDMKLTRQLARHRLGELPEDMELIRQLGKRNISDEEKSAKVKLTFRRWSGS